MKVTNFIWWLSWSGLLIASPLEERAVSSSACNNAQVKALRSSNAACYCSSYLQIPVSTVTKFTTLTSTIQTTVTQKQIVTKISTNNVKSTITTRTVTASPQTGYTTLTKTVTVTPQAQSLHRRKHLGHPGELVERAAVSICATPAVVKSMNKVAISSACKCLSIAPRRITITKATTERVTQVSIKVLSSTALRTTTIKSSLTAVATFTPPLKLVTRTLVVTVTAKKSTSSRTKSTSISSVVNNGASRFSSMTSSRSMSSLSAAASSSSRSTADSRTSSSKSSDSASSSKLAPASPTFSPSSSTVTSTRSFSKSTSLSSDKPASFSSSSQFSSSKSSSTMSVFPSSTAGDAEVPSKTLASSTDVSSSRLFSTSTSGMSSVASSTPSSELSSTSSSETSRSSSSTTSGKLSSISSSKTSVALTSSSSKKSSSSTKTTTSETASIRAYPPEGPLYTPNTNACASRTAKSSTSSTTRSRTSSTFSSSRSTLTSSTLSMSSKSAMTASILSVSSRSSTSTRSSSTPRFSFPSNSTMSSSTTANPPSSSSSPPAVNRFTYDDSSTDDISSADNTTSSYSNSTSANIPTSLLNTSFQNFTPNKPFYLQSLCTSGLEISGLYATLISTNSNPALQFTASTSLATQFYLSTSGYLYVMPPSAAYPWQSYSDQKLLANIDASVTEMDFFFNEKEEIDAIGAEMPSCGVDEDGVLQCKTSQTNEVLYCEGEGTVKLAGCVLEGCDAAELAVVYV